MKMVRVFVTGGAGFIGSHICDRILDLGHEVVCFDNLATGFKENIEHLRNNSRFTFIEGDIRNTELLDIHLPNCTHVCHQAALGSVPRSIENPRRTNEFNIVGSLNVLTKAQEHSIDRLVFASSSSVYGDNVDMPKFEDRTGNVLSPYAVTKSAFENYARVFNHIHGMETIGLRYFNVFGPRQSPEGAYAAVIPLFMKALSEGERPKIFGDGEQTRDFTYVQNAVDANILSLFGDIPDAYGKSFNIACGNTLSINEVFNKIRESIDIRLGSGHIEPIYAPPREGDIKDSLADLTEARRCLNYFPKVDFSEGIENTVSWFIEEKK
tara:strand:- start:138 stop:1109 length:972 start_codon:yes stop_codon:yes gene_type:complete